MQELCGNSSVVERYLAKVNVAGSSLVSRSNSSGSESETDFDRRYGRIFFIAIIPIPLGFPLRKAARLPRAKTRERFHAGNMFLFS